MTNEERRRLAVETAWKWYGRWYSWGGSDPSGIDCSGLAYKVCRNTGMLPKGDATADMLYQRFKHLLIPLDQTKPGCLVCWMNDAGRVTHIEIAVSSHHSIGAAGGSSKAPGLAKGIAQDILSNLSALGLIFAEETKAFFQALFFEAVMRQDAIGRDAFVDVHPIRTSHSGRVLVVDPYDARNTVHFDE